MKLYKFEHDEKGIWYFTDTAKGAKFINTTQSYVDLCRKKQKKCKGWSIEEIYDDYIISMYINPEKNI